MKRRIVALVLWIISLAALLPATALLMWIDIRYVMNGITEGSGLDVFLCNIVFAAVTAGVLTLNALNLILLNSVKKSARVSPKIQMRRFTAQKNGCIAAMLMPVAVYFIQIVVLFI